MRLARPSPSKPHAKSDAGHKSCAPPEYGARNLVCYGCREDCEPTESAVVDTVEIPILSERELARLKTGNRDNIAFDELGNAVWQFAPEEDTEPANAGRPVRNLDHPALSIVDDEPAPSATIRTNVKGLQTGYNPYDSGQLARKVARKPRDMRELSRWIELRKKLGAGK